MRRVLVAVAVLVLGAWTCAPPRGGGDDVAGVSTAGLAALIEGEDWHYVGATDEPAFENSWGNVGNMDLAFRLREAGVVDIEGIIGGGSTGTVAATLPEGYRPSTTGFFAAVGNDSVSAMGGVTHVPVRVDLEDNGSLRLTWSNAATVDRVFVAGQVFLDPPGTAP